MKTLLKILSVCIVLLCVSCGKIEDKQVTISFAGAKKAVRIGDYYWMQGQGEMVIAADSKKNPIGWIQKSDNPSDYHTVESFLQKSSPGSSR